ncbi:MAG: ectoine/hydroxyectoine ABC transporter substrate-binding protein EhuB [Actinomycetota bacterium]|nr:ectoine/hydroxyectoine ABC transporter substrate-binding protein EhuB [Actinomycetota bacterium]
MTEHIWTRRMFLTRVGVAAVAAPTLLSACSTTDPSTGAAEDGGGDPLQRLKDQGYVRVGFANEAPYGYAEADGTLTGEAPEVARAVFEALGIPELQGVLTEFGSLIPGLQARRFDVIAAGMFINPDRCAEIAFSDPDYQAKVAFMVPAGNPMGIETYEDVTSTGARLGVLTGAVEGGYAEALGVPAGQIVTFTDQPSMFDGLAAGRADAISLTSISLRNMLAAREGAPFEVTEPFVPVIDGQEQTGAGGYGFHRDDQALVDAFNEELAELKESGRLLEIIEPFGFTEAELPEVTTEELCQA